MTETVFSKLSDDVLLNIFFKLEDDPRNWARLACVCTKFSSLVRNICWQTKCCKTIPAVVADLISPNSSVPPGGWSSLHKLSVCCPGLHHAGVLLENSDFGLERELGPDANYQSSTAIQPPTTSSTEPCTSTLNSGTDCCWSLFDDLYYDTVYNKSESQDNDGNLVMEDVEQCEVKVGHEVSSYKRRKFSRSLRSHLASGVWNLSREQGNKLLASRFRGDCLYICDWPGCVHIEEKRNYMLFRGIFKNFKRSRVWRTINDGNRSKIDLNCAFCSCKETWDLHSAFCLRRVFGYHDDGLAADGYSRHDFLPGFVFGSGTSAYQVEGAANEDGRTPSIWDTFAHAGNVHGTGDVASDQYHKYKEDVKLMVDTGLDAYRFSISWSRVIPNGRGPVNPKGLEYYDNLINELISHGIQLHVTLHNYDLPQALEDEYGGWVNRSIVKDFTAYADVCFREFGDRVSYWTTVNEPNIFTVGGYDAGIVPPKRCSPSCNDCSRGNSSTEPYLAVHHILLAHASVARLYKKNYQDKRLGYIGVSIYAFGVLNPLVYGDYPNTMKKIVGSRLPVFTNSESKQVRGSADFLGLIHYMTVYIKDNPSSLKQELRDWDADKAAEYFLKVDNPSANELPVEPNGLQIVLEYLKQVYGNPPIYIYENGQQTPRNSLLEDISRVKYLHAYVGAVLDSIWNGSNTRGYFTWSFLDVFELVDGYESRYGLYYVDFDDPDLKRYPKLSAHWYSNFLKGRSMRSDEVFKLQKYLSAHSYGRYIQ
ncbi:putative Beta-glucosidase [Melia azedarach]|uniref:Beta-glucosidase n=1 Tax=Melia azedarach TaxID=155640 RepID=A0ACC1YW43_MELAZ|nr:putative Beta-glucosidase [Melia azedarach]